MGFHLVLPRRIDMAQAAEDAAAGLCPRQGMSVLRQSLQATVHQPPSDGATPLDRVRAKVLPPNGLWGLARQVIKQTDASDRIFCSSEAGGFQLAAMCGKGPTRPRIAVFVHNVDRPRARLALQLWQISAKVDLFFACSSAQSDFLRNHLRLSDDRVRDVWDHTDTCFFTPGQASAAKKRPLIVSVGLEQRDYKLLAAATHDLDVDVRISGFSKDAAANARTFPAPLPKNMSRQFYAWPDLVQLYRDADLVVVSSFENRYAAGVQSLMEAQACARPVVATATQGLSAYLNDTVVQTPPGDVKSMRSAIVGVLDAPTEAADRARRGYALAQSRYSMEAYVREISDAMRALA